MRDNEVENKMWEKESRKRENMNSFFWKISIGYFIEQFKSTTASEIDWLKGTDAR